MKSVRFTNHAIARMRQMGLSTEEIEEVVNDAEVDYSQEDYGTGRRLAQRGALAVAYALDSGVAVVVTILERKQERWER